MIYQAKPQRGGRSQPTNSNNPPQDPPGPNEIPTPTPEIVPTVEVTTPIIKPIEELLTVPLKIEPIKVKTPKKVITHVVKPRFSIKLLIVKFFKRIFRRK